MSSQAARVDIWRPRGLDRVELHRGTDVTLDYPRHWHDTFYICVVTRGTSRLHVRGASLTTTPHTLGIVPSGEVHANQKTDCTFRCLFIAPDLLRSAIEQFLERSIPAPEFRSGVISDIQAAHRFLESHRVLENPSSELERDASLFDFLQQFISRHGAATVAPPKEAAEDNAVLRAKRLLAERYADPVSLCELARLTGLSPFHLNRSFARKVGMPPHAYQLQLRLKRAKAFLGEGRSATEAASMSGFFDQSHFTHHFKRSERMTPRNISVIARTYKTTGAIPLILVAPRSVLRSSHLPRIHVVPCFAALLVIVSVLPLFADSVANSERSITKLADGVYEIRHPDAPDGFPQGNTLVVIGDRGALVVDSAFLPSSTRSDIDQIRKWTDKPVTYLVNTHWHFDHTMGNGLYVEAFPSVQVVAQKEMQKLIRDVNPGALRRYPQRRDATALALKTGKKTDGTPLTEGERKRYELRLAGLEPTLAELKNVVEFAPNVAFDRELDIDLGHRPVQIRFLGRGNTSGDTVIYLPVEKILAAGDLMDHPVPYFFGDISVDHVNTLKAIAQLDFDTIVPGHGEVLHGKHYLYQVMDLLTAVNTEVEKELNAGAKTSDEVQQGLAKVIDVGAWRNQFVGPDPRDRNFFDVNLRALVEASFQQISTR